MPDFKGDEGPLFPTVLRGKHADPPPKGEDGAADGLF
jgi:hypothetical protein